MKNEIRYFSMFSGVGGFELGIENTIRKRKCIGFSEIDSSAVEIYEKRFPTHKNYGNATKINPKELPEFDLLCAGFPCQAFSIAGKRKGFEDTRGTLFFEIARILKSKKPSYCILENVKGLLSHNKGKTFRKIIQTMDELGYEIQWMVLNSKFFGVPQNRERVFIIGYIRGKSPLQILPFRKNYGKLNSKSEKRLELLYDGDYQNKRIYSVEGISPTIPTGKSGGNHIPFIATHWQRSSKTNKGGTGMLTSTDFSFTLDRSPHYVNGIRKLTPTECERLQGFPENWTKGASDTQRYSMMGNAVTVNVIEAIMDSFQRNNLPN
jgi:DNA (cytosine-5)-methyltransferase 1